MEDSCNHKLLFISSETITTYKYMCKCCSRFFNHSYSDNNPAKKSVAKVVKKESPEIYERYECGACEFDLSVSKKCKYCDVMW